MEKVRDILNLLGFLLQRYEENAEGRAAARVFVEVHKRLGKDGDVGAAKEQLKEQNASAEMMQRLVRELFGMEVAEARLFYQQLTKSHNQWTQWADNLFEVTGMLDIVRESGTEKDWADLQKGDSIEDMELMVAALEDQLEVAEARAKALIDGLDIGEATDLILPGGIELL